MAQKPVNALPRLTGRGICLLDAILQSISHTFYSAETNAFFNEEKILFLIGFMSFAIAIIFIRKGANTLQNIDFDNITDEIVYGLFEVDGNESEALNDIYLELFELVGREAMLRIFKHFRGDKMDLPMRLYRPEFIADIAKPVTDRRERAKIARAGGYSARVIEGLLNKRRKEIDE